MKPFIIEFYPPLSAFEFCFFSRGQARLKASRPTSRTKLTNLHKIAQSLSSYVQQLTASTTINYQTKILQIHKPLPTPNTNIDSSKTYPAATKRKFTTFLGKSSWQSANTHNPKKPLVLTKRPCIGDYWKLSALKFLPTPTELNEFPFVRAHGAVKTSSSLTTKPGSNHCHTSIRNANVSCWAPDSRRARGANPLLISH